jgi:asparagine synthase (glutamine-hydrolysing)
VFPKFCVSRLAAEDVKVCLGGQGGDEVFVGYPRYLMAFLENELSRGMGFGALRAWWRIASLRSKARFFGGLMRTGGLPAHFLHFIAVNGPSRWERLVGDGLRGALDGYAPFDSYRDLIGLQGGGLTGLQTYELKTFLQGLLHVEDRVSMAWGLESRLPLLDHRVVELVLGLPAGIRTAGYRAKGLMRDVVRSWLPESVNSRTDKLGFPTPFRLWAGGPLRPKIGELFRNSCLLDKGLVSRSALEGLIGRGRYGDMEGLTLWALVAMEIWERVFIEKERG